MKQPRKPGAGRHTVGSVFNPQIAKAEHRVHFQYDPSGTSFEVELLHSGALSVRITGGHTDQILVSPNVSNHVHIIPRRWDAEKSAHCEFLDHKAGDEDGLRRV